MQKNIAIEQRVGIRINKTRERVLTKKIYRLPTGFNVQKGVNPGQPRHQQPHQG